MAKIIKIIALVIDINKVSESAWEAYEKDFKRLDCEFEDYISKRCLSDEFIKMIALTHEIEVSDFTHIQSMF